MGFYHNLHQSLSLQSVGLYTDVFNHGRMCSSARDYENAISDVKERFVAGQLVFQGAWNAFEIAGEALFAHGKNQRHRLSAISSKGLAISRFLGLRKQFSRHIRRLAFISIHKSGPSKRRNQTIGTAVYAA